MASLISDGSHLGAPAFRRPLFLLAIGLMAVLNAACSTHTSGQARLSTAEIVAPPMGVFEFCVERLAECGVPSQATKLTATEKSETVDAVPLTEDEILDLAIEVNLAVNAAISYRSDIDQWGREEAWSLPISDLEIPYGDCEDYVLEKRLALIDAGVPRERLSIATVWSRATGAHAVLVVRLANMDYVLDNTNPYVLPVGETMYQWSALQTGASLLTWVRVASDEMGVGDSLIMQTG